jgi:hypothetical protein
MQRKVVLSCIVPYNQLYAMTKCKVKSKAFTRIRAHTRWNWAWSQSWKSTWPLVVPSISVIVVICSVKPNFAMIPSFTGFYVIMVLCSVKLGIMGKKL